MRIDARTVIARARDWLGTPYLEGAAVRGTGADCAGFILGVFGGLGLPLIHPGSLQTVLPANAGHLESAAPAPARILVLSRNPGGPPVHLALLSESDTLLHAHWSRGVVENRFGRWFSSRVHACYHVKGIQPWQP
jgi:cell wall-associated NlpC family hydrolase